MAIKDYAQDGTPSCPWSGDPPNSGPNNIPNINDNNDNSYGNINQVWNGSVKTTNAEWTVALTKAYYLTKIKAIYAFDISASAGLGGTGEFWIDYYNGSWQNLFHQAQFTTDITKTTKQYTAGYNNVTKIRFKIILRAWGSGGPPGGAGNFCYTLAAEGYHFPDSGLRIKTADVIKIIGKDTILTGNPLRLYDGSQVIAIPLVDPSHLYAIPGLRIYDGAVKCLVEKAI